MSEIADQAAYSSNGERCTRDAFYAVACDPRRHVLVQACAGAGKTWMLVSRIVRALIEMQLRSEREGVPFEPHSILAITFTKKAAGEMRERLMQWLRQWQGADDATLDKALVERGLWSEFQGKNGSLRASDLRRVLSNLYQTLLDAPRGVQLRTFHSWFATLVRSAPLSVLESLQLPASYELLEDDAQAVALVWPRFYAQLGKDGALRAVYDETVAAIGRYNTEQALENALGKRVEFALADAQGVVGRSVPSFQEAFADMASLAHPHAHAQRAGTRELLYSAAQSLAQAEARTYAEKGVELEMALTNGDGAAVIAALLTKEGTARKFGKKMPDVEVVARAQDVALRMQEAVQHHEAWLHQQRMAQLTRALIACFKDLKTERGWVDMGDLETASLQLLSDPVLSGWVQQRLDANIRHLLIDEFQDTNPLQWQALHAWLAGYGGAGGGADAPRVFIVGDVKQSIYRFRRAEPQVFAAALEFVTQGLGGDVLSCDHTRRNAPAVLAAVNAIMLPAAQELGADYEYRAHSTELGDQRGEVFMLPFIAKPEKEAAVTTPDWRDSLSTPRDEPDERQIDRECAQATDWIAAQLAGGTPAGEIMVLARKRTRLAALADALRERGIAHEVAEKSTLIEHAAVQDVVALIEAVLSPIHDQALARALRSPLLGWSDEDLAQLAACVMRRAKPDGKPGRSSWWDALLSLSKDEQTIEPGCAQTADFVQKTQITTTLLKQLQSWLATLPPHDALTHLYAACDVPRCFMAAAPAALREAMRLQLAALHRSALEAEGGRMLTPAMWLHALKSGAMAAPPASHSQDAVRLLTVHGAKGLEADAVLMLDTHASPEKTRTLDVLMDWPGQSAAPKLFAFLRSESQVPIILKEAVAHEQAARTREEINALYVAMTRAKHTLAFSAHEVARPDERSPWARLQVANQNQAAHQVAMQEQGDLATALTSIAPSKREPIQVHSDVFFIKKTPLARIQTAQSAIKSVVKSDPGSSRIALIGQAMHRLLERYRVDAGMAPASSVQREFGLSPAEAQQAHARALAITQGRASWVWNAQHIDWQANEAELHHGGQLLRMDRLVRERESQTWWVLDYKSALRPELQSALREQLALYRSALQAVYPGQAVQAAFINGQGELLVLD
jgi:ATP-dependent helicase/nuclease subunit A